MNDKEFIRKVLASLFLHPLVVFPLGIGTVLMLMSLSGVRSLRYLALMGMSVGVCALFARVTIGFNGVAHKVFSKWQRDVQKSQTEKLDDLDSRLQADDDPRNEQALRRLRSIYKVFVECVQDGRVKEYNFLNTAEKLFHTSIQKLDEGMDVWRQAMEMPGDKRQPFLDHRNELILEVEQSVDTLAQAVHEVQRMTSKDGKELASLRGEMDKRLEMARKVEERIANIEAAGERMIEKAELHNNDVQRRLG
jgi:hypothetical protein